MKSSWRTTLFGIASILGALAALAHAGANGTITQADLTTFLTAVTTGVGLLFARDHSVSSEEAGATPAQKAAVQSIATQAATTPTKTT